MEDQARKKGGENRSKSLTPERRKEIASAAAKARHEKRRLAAQQEQPPTSEPAPDTAPPPVVEAQPAPQEKQEPPRKIKAPPVPKVFGQALAAAEKQYVSDLQDLAYHEQMVAIIRARIPSTVQTIRALGGIVNPETTAAANHMDTLRQAGSEVMAVPMMPQQQQAAAPINLPPIPRAHGGALGVIDEPMAPKEDENMFLREGEQGKWL